MDWLKGDKERVWRGFRLMITVCQQDGGERRVDLPFGDGAALHNDVLFVRPSAPEN